MTDEWVSEWMNGWEKGRNETATVKKNQRPVCVLLNRIRLIAMILILRVISFNFDGVCLCCHDDINTK